MKKDAIDETAECFAICRQIGEHYGKAICMAAITGGWPVEELEAAVEQRMQEIRSALIEGCDEPARHAQDIEVALRHIHVALLAAGKHSAMLLLLNEGGHA